MIRFDAAKHIYDYGIKKEDSDTTTIRMNYWNLAMEKAREVKRQRVNVGSYGSLG